MQDNNTKAAELAEKHYKAAGDVAAKASHITLSSAYGVFDNPDLSPQDKQTSLASIYKSGYNMVANYLQQSAEIS